MTELGIRAGSLRQGRRASAGVAPAETGAGTGVRVVPVAEAAALPGVDALADAAAEDNVFFHPDFLGPAVAHLAPEVRVAVAMRGSHARAMAPVIQARLGRIAPAVRVWSHDYGPLGTPLADARDPAAAAALLGAAAGVSLIVPDIALDGPVMAVFRRAAEAEGRPVAVVDARQRALLLRATGADPRAALPRRRRKEFARQMRRLADLGSLAVESTAEADCVRARFEEFLALEARGWKGRKGTALASSLATAEFAREAVFNRSAAGGVRIDSIRLDDRPVAILVTFLAGRTAFTWKIAYDESFARYSPGAQLMLEAAKSLFQAVPAVDRIDSCAASDHPMIDHLWPDRLAIGTLVVGPPGGGGVVHRLGLAALRAETVARQAARRLRDRLRAGRGNRETEA